VVERDNLVVATVDDQYRAMNVPDIIACRVTEVA
jgi:hypothetical protein